MGISVVLTVLWLAAMPFLTGFLGTLTVSWMVTVLLLVGLMAPMHWVKCENHIIIL